MIKVRVTRKGLGASGGFYPVGSVLEVSQRTFDAFRDRLERVESTKPVSKPASKAPAKFEPMAPVSMVEEPEAEEVEEPEAEEPEAEEPEAEEPEISGQSVRQALETIASTEDLDLLHKWSADSRVSIRKTIARRLRALGAGDE